MLPPSRACLAPACNTKPPRYHVTLYYHPAIVDKLHMFPRTCSFNSLEQDVMSDFWAGYISGAIGIVIGNPLDVIKVRLQAGNRTDASTTSHLSRFEKTSSLVRGSFAIEPPL